MTGERFTNAGTLSKYAFAARIENMKQASIGNLVIEDGEVTEQGPAAMAIDFAAGQIYLNGSLVNFASGSQAIDAANVTNPRWDIISVDSSGTVNYAVGTPKALNPPTDLGPFPPDLPVDEVALAYVFVAANETTINTADILDGREIGQAGIELIKTMQQEQSEQAIDIIQLQQDAGIIGGTHTGSIADILIDSTGYLDTIDTGNNLAVTYDSTNDLYYPDVTDGTNIDADTWTGSNNDPWNGRWSAAVLTASATATVDIQGNEGRLDHTNTLGTVTVNEVATHNLSTSGVNEMIKYTITPTEFNFYGAAGNAGFFFGIKNGSTLICRIGIGNHSISDWSVNIGEVKQTSTNATNKVVEIYVQRVTDATVQVRVYIDGTLDSQAYATSVSTAVFFYMYAVGGRESYVDYDNWSVDNATIDTNYVQTEALISGNATNINSTWLTVKHTNDLFTPSITYQASSDSSNWTTGLTSGSKQTLTSTLGDSLKLRLISPYLLGIGAYSVAWWD